MHWKGLWATFAHHGDVLDSFIPQKKSRSGKRFGSIRFATRTDAAMAIYRLNGFLLFGFRIYVAYARTKDVGNKSQRTTAKVANLIEKNKGKCTVDSRISMQIGESSKANNRGRIQDRLSNWGFGEISVKKMGGRYFLLSFNDEELYKLLEDLNSPT
ncbi:hypothetical protein V6N13_113497 [Hibiscus sabdariffa]